ncbi:hypothetical protein I7I53_08563 [Histoplasma capsulatum var. duboisii H88]|uniref:Uncharacterized protein n=1 Tax=Ajellomyces capsulatus (strain H88) TaxID=544711 RepID=A0A8A1LLV2_AJEC8|nr:hypothetical protein I7I53_08563 [Histoplasma capsulatum var. duboisii H88]
MVRISMGPPPSIKAPSSAFLHSLVRLETLPLTFSLPRRDISSRSLTLSYLKVVSTARELWLNSRTLLLRYGCWCSLWLQFPGRSCSRFLAIYGTERQSHSSREEQSIKLPLKKP